MDSDDLPGPGPYIEFGRDSWSRLSESTPLPLTDADVERLRGLGDPLDLNEVDIVYRPLSRLLSLYVSATGTLHQASSTFLHERWDGTPSSLASPVRSRWENLRSPGFCARCWPAGRRPRKSI